MKDTDVPQPGSIFFPPEWRTRRKMHERFAARAAISALAPKVRLQRRGELQISLEKRERLLPRLVCSLSVVVRTVLKREGVIDPRDDQHLWRRVRLGKAMRR